MYSTPAPVASRIRALALLLLIALCAFVYAPAAACADDYDMPSVNIEAQVQADGSVQVSETRAFEFDDDVNGVYWVIPLAENQQGTQSDITIDGVSVDGTAFAYADAAYSGDNGVYTVESSSYDGTDEVKIKVFTPHGEDTTASVRVAYTLTGAVMRWNDTAELYWKFVGDEWAEDSENVNLTVTFDDSLTSAAPATKKTLRAWGHGSLTGTVTPDVAGASVTYYLPTVHEGQYAEARIAFPNAWVPQATEADTSGSDRLKTILSEERVWADEANAQRERARALSIGSAIGIAVLSGAFALVTIVLRARRKDPKPVFQETYFRDVPSADHPSMIAAFMNDGKVPDRAFVAALMKLTDDRVIKLSQQSVTEKGLFGRERTREDYVVEAKASAIKALSDPVDRAAARLFFVGAEKDEDGMRTRSFNDLSAYASEHPKRYSDKYDDYKGAVEGALEDRELVASEGKFAMVATIVAAVILAVINVGQLIVTDLADANLISFLISTAFIVAGFVAGCTFKRLTQEGCELQAKCKALKKWLEDFTRLKEAVPDDLVLWNKLLVMGVALGVSQEVIKQLADAVPAQIRERDDFYDMYPAYWWCYPHGGMHAPGEQLRTAYTESISELAGSSDSSGGGFGGGFSSGGGGGVGGGGGGTF